ncbi:tetratricopeptide repeat protein [Limnohabitans sp.]|uniref:tetratricopeptide repeat protein n=1 Tax=Limnohabitans sp. TaxID=1907725 RepID=UPI00286F9D2D|nr:tetratricopeptide repeat protein [Limnohabitans sp.]
MSLVNQMLKDIDKRHAASSATPASHKDLQGVIRSAFPWHTLLLGGGLVAALVMAGVVVFKGKREPVPVSAPVAVQLPIVVASAPVQVASLAAVSKPAEQPKLVEPPKPEEPIKAVVPALKPTPTLIEKPAPSGSVSRVLTAEQRAENLYLDAVERIRQGQNSDAQGALRRALSEYPLHHASRQLLARSLLETGQVDSAKTMLRDGLTLAPQRLDFYMALAQASLVGNDLEAAIKTMESGLPVASDNAEFHALLANLLQRNSRHDEAIQHFVTSLRKQPDSANVLLGLGISLQEKKDKASAAEAYQRAIELGLSPSLMQFAQDRLRQLNR